MAIFNLCTTTAILLTINRKSHIIDVFARVLHTHTAVAR